MWALLAIVMVIAAIHALVELLGLNRWVVRDAMGQFLQSSGGWSKDLPNAWQGSSRAADDLVARYEGVERIRFTRAVLSV